MEKRPSKQDSPDSMRHPLRRNMRQPIEAAHARHAFCFVDAGVCFAPLSMRIFSAAATAA
jgi:hypothetical protein